MHRASSVWISCLFFFILSKSIIQILTFDLYPFTTKMCQIPITAILMRNLKKCGETAAITVQSFTLAFSRRRIEFA